MKTIKNTYVALFDILGFKEIVKNNSHEELIKIYEKLDRLLKFSLCLCRLNKEFQYDFSKTIINSINISDSILLWTNDVNVTSFYDLILTSWELQFQSIYAGLPMTGAITVGPISIIQDRIQAQTQTENFRSTFFGKPIVEAFELVSKQLWAGSLITNETIEVYENNLFRFVRTFDDPLFIDPYRIEKSISIHGLKRRKILREFDVPFKKKPYSQRYLTLNWPDKTRTRISEKQIRERFLRHNKFIRKKSVHKLIENTITYLIE